MILTILLLASTAVSALLAWQTQRWLDEALETAEWALDQLEKERRRTP